MGYLSTLLVCKAVQAAGRLGDHVAGRVAFSYITQMPLPTSQRGTPIYENIYCLLLLLKLMGLMTSTRCIVTR